MPLSLLVYSTFQPAAVACLPASLKDYCFDCHPASVHACLFVYILPCQPFSLPNSLPRCLQVCLPASLICASLHACHHATCLYVDLSLCQPAITVYCLSSSLLASMSAITTTSCYYASLSLYASCFVHLSVCHYESLHNVSV